MAQSGFEDKRGLAYPPNVQPKLEAWMERVRVTLGKLLDSSVDAARINAVTLDVDESGNVTAQITPNENTKWIEYYGLITDYPTLAQIVTSGTEVRVWDTPGETYTTGTLITLTTGQTYYFGAVAYEEEEADQANPALSTSVPVYAEITFSEGGADTDTIVPTVEELVTKTGTPATSGTVTLVITDPDVYVTQVSFRTWTGGAWNSWVDDPAPAPYDLDETVTMQELHNVGIEWKVLYDLGGGRDVETISNVVMFDIDTNPELSEGYLTVDTTDGDVYFRYVGDDDTLSVGYATSDTDWATDVLAKADAEDIGDKGTAIDGRTGPDATGTVVKASLAEGDTWYVAVSANNGADAAGAIFGSQVYRYQITRPTDTNDDTIPPRVTGDIIYDGAGNATLSLVVAWGTYSTGTVEFKAKSGLAAWESSWTEDTGPSPFTHPVVLDEKHDSHIKYLITYGSSLTIGDVVTIDVDRIPELQTAYIFIDDDGDAKLVWNGDDDVDYIVYQYATGASPAYPAVWSTPPVVGDGTRDPTDPTTARNGEVVVASGMTEGEECAVSFYMFRSTGENSMIPYQVRSSYRSGTLLPPTVTETASESGAVGTLTIDAVDPQGQDLEIKFWTRRGHYAEVGPDTRSALSAPVSEDDTVALYEKENSTIRYEVTNVAGFTVGGSVPFDTDRLPNIYSPSLDLGTDGKAMLSWVGDSDTLSVTYDYVISTEETPLDYSDVDDPDTASNVKTGRTGNGYIYEDGDEDGTEAQLNQGETIYVKVRGYTHATPSSGDPGEIARVSATMPIDTTGSSNLVANGDIEAGVSYWGGLKYIGGGPIYTLWTVTSGGEAIDGTSLKLLGQPSQAVYVYTSTVLNGEFYYQNETISCAEDDRIDVSVDAYVSGAHTLTMKVRYYNSSKVFISESTLLSWTEVVATPKSVSFTVTEATAAYCGFYFYIPADATDAKYAIVDNVVAQFRIAFSDYPVSSLEDVATYSTTTNDVLTWTGSEWDSVAPASADSALLSDIGDVNSGYEDTDLLYRNGTSWVGQTRIELGLMTTLSVMVDGSLKGSHQKINFIEGSGVTILGENNDPSNRVDVTISVDPAGNISSGGSNDGDYDIVIDANSGSTSVFRVENSAQSLMTVNETGDLNCIGDVQAQNVYATDNFELGGTSGTPECSIISNTAYLQLDAGGYLWCVDGDIRIGPSATGDMKINEPTAGKWTIYTPGSTTATGNGLYLDDGGTNNAKVVSIKAITTSGTAPTGDYPYGTLHLIY